MHPESPHDKLFKKIFSDATLAAAELRALLPPALLPHVALDRLQLTPTSLVDASLRDRYTDLLFKAPVAGRPSFVYLLFEHLSTSPRWTTLRLLGYVVRIWEDFLAQNRRSRFLPPVIPIVIHHSETGWTAASSLHQLFDPQLRRLPELARWLPSFELLVDDLSHVSNLELQARRFEPFLELGLWLLRDGRNVRRFLTNAAFFLRQELGLTPEQIVTLLSYTYRVVDLPRQEIDEVYLRHAPNTEPHMPNAYQELFEQGREQGIQQGREQGIQQGREQGIQQGREQGIQQGRAATLLKLLTLKFGAVPESVQRRIQNASDSDLELWTERVLSAASLGEVLK